MIDPVQAAGWIAGGRAALDLLRSAAALLPGRDDEAIARRLDDAGQALELASAWLARDLGYPICRCVFPPKPMLWDEARAAFVCREPGCGRAEPSG